MALPPPKQTYKIFIALAVLNFLVKSLPTSLCQREETGISPFGNLFPAKGRQRGMKGDFIMTLSIY
jgi:hypothetical protein